MKENSANAINSTPIFSLIILFFKKENIMYIYTTIFEG